MSDRLSEMMESALTNVHANPALSSSESVRLVGEFGWMGLYGPLLMRIEDVAVFVDWQEMVPNARYSGVHDVRGVLQAVADQDADALRVHSRASDYFELVTSLLLVIAVLRDAASV